MASLLMIGAAESVSEMSTKFCVIKDDLTYMLLHKS